MEAKIDAWAVFSPMGGIRLHSMSYAEDDSWAAVEKTSSHSIELLKRQGYTCHQVEITKKPAGE